MLDAAIYFLSTELNMYLTRLSLEVVKAEPGNIANDNGTWAVPENTIGLAVVNVEEERTLRTQAPERVLVNGSQVVRPADLKLNLTVVFAVRHAKYDHALRYLSYVLRFFQGHPTFTPSEYPALDPSIGKLSVELLSYGPDQLSQLWTYLGAKYLPSVIYRVRMLVLRETDPSGVDVPIAEIDAEVNVR